MNAVMINMMALNGAIFMTIRNLVFGPKPGNNIQYVNYGYGKNKPKQKKRPVLIIHSKAAFVKQPNLSHGKQHGGNYQGNFQGAQDSGYHAPGIGQFGQSNIEQHFQNQDNIIGYTQKNEQFGKRRDGVFSNNFNVQKETGVNKYQRISSNILLENYSTSQKPKLLYLPRVPPPGTEDEDEDKADALGPSKTDESVTQGLSQKNFQVARNRVGEFKPSPQWNPIIEAKERRS